MEMPWGKFRGEDLGNIPTSYLVWVFESCDLDFDLSEAIRFEFADRLGLDIPVAPSPSPPLAHCDQCALIAREWPALYSRLAKQVHPDRGGSHEAMLLANQINELLSN